MALPARRPGAAGAALPERKPGNGLAIGAFICAWCAIIPGIGVLSALAAIVLGIVALVQKVPGKGLAIASLIIAPVLGIGSTALLVVPLGKARELAIRATSSANLKSIGSAMIVYSGANRDQMPESLDQLVRESYVNCGMLVYPGHRGEAPELIDGKLVGRVDYEYVYPGPRWQDLDDDLVLAHEKRGLSEKGVNVLHIDQSVTWMSWDEFERLKARTLLAIERQRVLKTRETLSERQRKNGK